MIAEYFHCTTALSESVGKIGSASKHQVSFSIPQQFRSTNIRFDEITVGYLHDLECSCPRMETRATRQPEIRRAESRLQQSVHRGDFTTLYTFKSRRRGHTPIKLRTFAKGGNRKSIGSDFSNGISIVFVSRRYHACFVRLPYNSVRILSDAADSEGETPGIGSFIDELRPIACATVL